MAGLIEKKGWEKGFLYFHRRTILLLPRLPRGVFQQPETGMTEAEWLACKDPRIMIELLRTERGAARKKWGRRKLRLFACACLRGIWPLLRQPGSRLAVVVAERFADELASSEELTNAYSAACVARYREGPELRTGSPFWQSAEAAVHVTARRFDSGDHVSIAHAASSAANAWALEQKQSGKGTEHDKLKAKQLSVYAQWLRDIVGNPFRPSSLSSAWLTPTLTGLSQSIYADRSFEDLPILADALEEAGCDSFELLGHLRESGPHVHGCWALGLILQKE
jgi:hypothetical protein